MSPTPPAPPPAARAAWALGLAAALAALGLFVWLAASRLPYPHELEWMEGAMVDHAARVAAGRPLYCAPGPEHVPFLYAPLLFWLGGLGMHLGLPGLLALRLVAALGSVGTAMLVGHWVRVETKQLVPGLVATGLFLAGDGWLWWWYDLARNDSLFVLATLGCAYLLRHGGPRRWLPAALLATFAVLAKQSALMWLPAIGVGALLHDWRNALRFGLAAAAALGLAFGVLHLSSGGWSTFYLFEMPRFHGIEGTRKLGFWTEDLRPMAPLVLLAGLGFVARIRAGDAGERRAALFLAAVGSGGLVTSWFSRMHVGGFDNVLLYGFAAACVLGPIAVLARARWMQFAAPALVLLQFAALGAYAVHRDPFRTALPSAAHRKAHEELLAYVKAQPGDVFIVGHGGIAAQAGKPATAHGQAIFDLLQMLPKLPNGFFDPTALADEARLAHLPARGREALLAFRDGVFAGLRDRRWSAIVLDDQIGAAFELLFAFGLVGPDGKPGTPDDLYRRTGPLLPDGPALCPPIGFAVGSPFAYEAVR